MKFGKQLESLAVPKYKGHYIQYKELKRALKVWTGVEKDQSTVQEATHWASSFLRLGPNPEISPEMRVNALMRQEMDRISKVVELEEGGIRKQLAQLEEDVEPGGGVRADMLKQFDDLCEQVVQLNAFAKLNFTGFRKALKKYDKWNEDKGVVSPWFMAEVARARFMNVDYGTLLEQVNRISQRLGPAVDADPPRFPLASSSSALLLDSKRKVGREISFLFEPRDAMRVRVHLAKHLVMQTPQGRHTTSVYMDTPSLDVYKSRLADPEQALPAAHVRHVGGAAAVLVYSPGAGAPSSEVLLEASDAAKLLEHGSLSLSKAPPAAEAQVVVGLEPPATGDLAAAAVAAVGAAIARDGSQPMVRASFARTVFRDGTGDIAAILDEDVRLSRAGVAPLDLPSAPTVYFPRSVLTVSWSMELPEDPMWLRSINDSTNLTQVSNFSKAAHALAYFFAKSRAAPKPHWYFNVMHAMDEVGDGADDAASKSSSADLVTLEAAKPDEVTATSGLTGARLLHEFGTSPQEQTAKLASASRFAEESGALPASDAGGLGAPLLARPAKAEKSQRRSPLARLAAVLGFAEPAPQTEAEAEGAMPVRNAIVAVQPKTLFSNERTFLEWVHFSVLFASMGVVLMHSGAAYHTLGRCMVVAGAFLVGWSLWTFNWRADALDSKEIRNYHDPIAPPLLIVILLVALRTSVGQALMSPER